MHHVDYEFYILVVDAIVDQMVHMVPLKYTFNKKEKNIIKITYKIELNVD